MPELKNNLVPRALFPHPGDEVVNKSIPREIVNFCHIDIRGKQNYLSPEEPVFQWFVIKLEILKVEIHQS